MAPSSGVQVMPSTAALSSVVPFASSSAQIPSRTSIVPLSIATTRPPRIHGTLSSRLSSIRTVLEPSLRVGPTKQRGRVSIEWLLALRDYTAHTSITRVAMVCILTPVPALVLALAIECIPLAPPSMGWLDQGMFWLRLLLTSALMTMLSGLGFKTVAGHALELSLWQLSAIGLLGATFYVSFFVGIAALWTFPVPFLFVIGGLPFVVSEVLAAFIVVDVRAIIAKVEGLKKRTEGINSVGSAVSMLFWIYPLYTVAFELAGPKYQVSLLLVLPIFKIQWKKRMCVKLGEVEDLVPVIMMFTIELFNALYLATCMQSSGSPMTTAIIILLDTTLGLTYMRRLHKQMAGLRKKIKGLKKGSAKCDLLEMFIARVSDPATTLKEGVLATVRIRGNGLEHDLTASSASIIAALEAKRMNTTEPPDIGGGSQRETQPLTAHTTAHSKSDDVVLNETLQFLFQCEFMVLAEYIECAIPLLYVVYLPILRGLHNGVYFGHVRSLSDDDLRNAELNIVVYWALESISLVVMMLWLQRHFAVSAFHVLAFVLDKHVLYVQANVILQILFALQFTIAHLGADFSFKFAWIKDPSATWWVRTP